MKHTQSTKSLLMLLATSGLMAIALPAAAENNSNVVVAQEKTAEVSTSEAAKSRTISDLQAFERSKPAASRSLEQKLQAFTAESTDEDGVLAQILGAHAGIEMVAGETIGKDAAFLKPQQSHRPPVEVERLPADDSVFLKPMQVHRPPVEVERLPADDSVFLKPMQVHRPQIELERLPVEDSVFLKPMQSPPVAN